MILVAATVYGMGQCFFWPVTLGIVSERFPKGGALTLNAIAGVGMLGVGIIGMPLMGYVQDRYIRGGLTERDSSALYERVQEEKGSIFGKYNALDMKKVARIQFAMKLHDLRGKAADAGALGVASEALSKKLAKDAKYQELVGQAYDASLRPADDASEKAHDVMHKAVVDAGMIVDKKGYDGLVADAKVLQEVSRSAKENAMATVAVLPLIMALCYVGLIVYFKATGGYRALDLTAGEHQVSTDEAVADAEATPNE